MEGRKCTVCGEKKAAKHFEKNGRMPDGSIRLRSICKACGSRKKKAHTLPKLCTACNKVKNPADFHGRHSWCRECRNKKTYAYRKGPGRDAHNKRMVQYVRSKWKEDPGYRQKTSARQAVYVAVNSGLLEKPTRCPKCNRRANLHAHHYLGYQPKNWLKVRWRCARCHFQEDKAAHA